MKCAKCGKEHDPRTAPPNDGCKGRIDIFYDLEKVREVISRKEIESRPHSGKKYKELMPIFNQANRIFLGEGNTSLIKSHYFSKELNLPNLLFKTEFINPTGSFKDRPIAIGVSKAVEDSIDTVAAASSGNAGAALATFAAAAGLRAVIFVPESSPASKLAQLFGVGAKLMRVRESAGGDNTTLILKNACDKYGWIPSPSFGPFNCWQFEGTKPIAYEICQQMNWNVPDWVLFATGSGGFCAGTMKGFNEFKEIGLIDRLPKAAIIQSTECQPLVNAFHKGLSFPETWQKSINTVAGGLADPYPWDADAAVHYLNLSNGAAIAVPDDETMAVHKLLAQREGMFVEPTAAVAVAGLVHLVTEGIIQNDETVVVPLSGSGFKDMAATGFKISEIPLINPIINELQASLKQYE